MGGSEPKRKRGRPRRNDNEINEEQAGIHGLVGLEISSLKKSINGETNYNFDNFLKNSIPEQYSIEIIDDLDRNKEIEKEFGEFQKFKCDEISNLINKNNENEDNINFNELINSVNKQFEIELIDHEKIKGPSEIIYNVGTDPLNDGMYNKIHDKLSRKEHKFNLIDRNKMLNEVDNCIELLSLLGTELKRGSLKENLRNYIVENIELSDEQIYRLSQLLGSITKINDPTDSIEMILKYRLTIREIRSFLLNFIKIKTLETYLKKEVQMIHSGQFERYIEPITNFNVNELKEKRLINRDSKIGSIVKINFKDGVTLEVDPISKPKVIYR